MLIKNFSLENVVNGWGKKIISGKYFFLMECISLIYAVINV